jgi:hypothetical protein
MVRHLPGASIRGVKAQGVADSGVSRSTLLELTGLIVFGTLPMQRRA